MHPGARLAATSFDDFVARLEAAGYRVEAA
jgi:hypothetical protein